MKPMNRLLTPAAPALAIAAFAIPALVASAIIFPAPAFAQNVSCTACTHEVSYFKGKGGLIAKADGDATEVTWVAQCGGVVRSGKLEANDDGIVSTLFDDDNNLACSGDDGRFRLGPITDGGWYWITDDENSAVGNLVNKDILGNVTTTLANAGSGVETAAGRGVTFVKETATGRVGILPNVLPVAPVPPTRKCGFTGTPAFGGKTSSQRRVATGCKLGDGKAILRIYGPVGPGGATAPLPNNTIVRPYVGEVELFSGIYMNGTGHFVKDANGDPDLGWVGGTCLGGARDDANRCGGHSAHSLVVLPGISGGFYRLLSSPSAYGAKISASRWGIAISRAGAGTYCGTPEAPKNNTMEIIRLMGFNRQADRERVVPTVPVSPPFAGSGLNPSLRFAATETIRVVCPSSPEAQALRRQGLMPESLFRSE